MNRDTCFAVGAIVLMLNFEVSLARADSSIEKQFHEEAQAAWLQYLQLASTIQGTVTTKTVNIESNHLIDGVSATYRQRDDWSCFWYENLIENASDVLPFATARVSNSLYSFEIVRKRKSDKWSIVKLDLQPQDSQGIDAEEWRQIVLRSTSANLFIDGWLLNEIVESDTFVPNRIEHQTTEQNNSLVRLTFSVEPPKAVSQDRNLRALQGWVLLDPERFWVIKSANILSRDVFGERSGAPSRLLIENEYHEDNGFPLPITSTVTRLPTGNSSRSSLKIMREFEMELDPSISEEKFKLASFGLPEPSLDWDKGRYTFRTMMWAILIVVGILGISLTVFMSRRMRN